MLTPVVDVKVNAAHAWFPFLPRFMATRVLGRDPTPGRWVLGGHGTDNVRTP